MSKGALKHLHADVAGTTPSAVGVAAPTLHGTQASADDADGAWLQGTASAGPGTLGGLITGFNWARGDWFWSLSMRIKTPSAIANTRQWHGLFSADPSGSDTPAVHIAAFRYSTFSDGTPFWRTVTAAAGALTVTTTTAAIAINSDYELRIRVKDDGNIEFYVDGTLVATHTTNLPTATVLLGFAAMVTALSGNTPNARFGWASLAHN